MKSKKRLLATFTAGLGMLLLLLDTKTAVTGTKDGVTLCTSVLIPSLFPFLILSAFLGNGLTGRKIAVLRPLGRWMGIPEGAESLFVLGLTGGYPVGAKAVCQAYSNGQLSKRDALRLLGFCSNAGPAFIFGMGSVLFQSLWAPWLLWVVHILSAILTGCLLPDKQSGRSSITKSKPLTISQAIEQSIRIMASICGWVVIFKALLAYFHKFDCPDGLEVLLTGVLELSNGFVAAAKIPSEGMRFLFCSIFLSFGGLCVGMQTVSVMDQLGTGMYFPGKILQCFISVLISIPIIWICFPEVDASLEILWLITAAIMSAIWSVLYLKRLNSKKTVAFV